jgi:hypothetical protein
VNWAIIGYEPVIATGSLFGNRSIGCRRLDDSTDVVQTDWAIRGIQLDISREVT